MTTTPCPTYLPQFDSSVQLSADKPARSLYRQKMPDRTVLGGLSVVAERLFTESR